VVQGRSDHDAFPAGWLADGCAAVGEAGFSAFASLSKKDMRRRPTVGWSGGNASFFRTQYTKKTNATKKHRRKSPTAIRPILPPRGHPGIAILATKA
jgi:hypothetical protein